MLRIAWMANKWVHIFDKRLFSFVGVFPDLLSTLTDFVGVLIDLLSNLIIFVGAFTNLLGDHAEFISTYTFFDYQYTGFAGETIYFPASLYSKFKALPRFVGNSIGKRQACLTNFCTRIRRITRLDTEKSQRTFFKALKSVLFRVLP